MQDRKALMIGCGLGLLLVMCLGFVAVLGGVGYFLAKEGGNLGFDGNPFQENQPDNAEVQPTKVVLPVELQGLEIETLQTLQNAEVPYADSVELAERLLGIEDIPDELIDINAPHAVGAKNDFWVFNTDTNISFRTTAELKYVTSHSYFWVEEGVNFDAKALKDLADEFESHIYPMNREFFGSEWSPGVDGDEHIYILYVGGTGGNNAGYFGSKDSLHPLAYEYSNAHEVFVFNADNVDFEDEFSYGVLAHEFQHMIHWNQDRNETSWMNEGFSEVAMLLTGYNIGGFDYSYIENPDLQLNDWPNNPDQTIPHYGASFLFLTYFLDRLGEDATK
ncbi:MAG: hypothetical protein N2D54_02395, partial [Chloroflexota bacterium]